MIAATNWIDLVQTLLLVLGALGVVGIVAAASAITSIRNRALDHQERLAEKHETHETARHNAEITYQATQAALDRDERRQDRQREITELEERGLAALEAATPQPRHRTFRRPI